MELDTIDMPAAEAAAVYEDYAAALKRRHNDEDAAIAAGYKALSQGKQVVSLQQTIRAGGVDEAGFPKLAIARANAQWCYVDRRRTGAVTFSASQNPRLHRSKALEVSVPEGTLPVVSHEAWIATPGAWDSSLSWTVADFRYRSMVPIVPPRLRPTRALTTYHVLWEAEWGKAPPPPGDPALLKHIGGDLWVVLATWDLTALERAVLSQRLNE